MKSGNETAIVKACLQLLHVRGVAAWRNNSGALPVGKRFVRFGTPGSSDILGLLAPSGRLLAVECKTATGRLSEAQRTFLGIVTAAGGLALVVRDVAQLDEALRLEGVA